MSDPDVNDEVLLEEISLLAEVMVRVSATAGHLTDAKIDEALGLRATRSRSAAPGTGLVRDGEPAPAEPNPDAWTTPETVVVERAVGVLMEIYGVSQDQARVLLSDHAHQYNVTVGSTARQVINRLLDLDKNPTREPPDLSALLDEAQAPQTE